VSVNAVLPRKGRPRLYLLTISFKSYTATSILRLHQTVRFFAVYSSPFSELQWIKLYQIWGIDGTIIEALQICFIFSINFATIRNDSDAAKATRVKKLRQNFGLFAPPCKINGTNLSNI